MKIRKSVKNDKFQDQWIIVDSYMIMLKIVTQNSRNIENKREIRMDTV